MKRKRVYVAQSKEGKTAYVVHYSRPEALKVLLQNRSEFPAHNKQLRIYSRPDKQALADAHDVGYYATPAPFEFGRWRIEDNPELAGNGTVYLLHFDEPFYHTQHYVGYTELPVEERLARHKRGGGSKMLRAVRDAGIDFKVVRTWENKSRKFESWLKCLHKIGRRCPVCSAVPEEGGEGNKGKKYGKESTDD